MIKQKEIAFLGMGSNIGDRFAQIEQAVRFLEDSCAIEVNKLSSVYETEPVGYLDQPKFLNLVCQIQTTLTPHQLLRLVQSIEQQLKRKRTIRWGPRTIDIDILLFGNQIIHDPDLIIPHPRMLQRSFVMIPLAELDPDRMIPGTTKTVVQWRQMLSDQSVSLYHQSIQV